MSLKNGDRVIVVKDGKTKNIDGSYNYYKKGDLGTYISPSKDSINVIFDDGRKNYLYTYNEMELYTEKEVIKPALKKEEGWGF